MGERILSKAKHMYSANAANKQNNLHKICKLLAQSSRYTAHTKQQEEPGMEADSKEDKCRDPGSDHASTPCCLAHQSRPCHMSLVWVGLGHQSGVCCHSPCKRHKRCYNRHTCNRIQKEIMKQECGELVDTIDTGSREGSWFI
jgi:hypothetical protein